MPTRDEEFRVCVFVCTLQETGYARSASLRTSLGPAASHFSIPAWITRNGSQRCRGADSLHRAGAV